MHRISEEDKRWLSRRENVYKKTLQLYQEIYNMCKAERESYSEEDTRDFGVLFVGNLEIPKQIDKLQNGYIEDIFYYFFKKYQVDFQNPFPKSNLAQEWDEENSLVVEEIDLNTILNEILSQLGGLSFEEKARKEIKDVIFKESYVDGEYQIKRNRDKLTLLNGNIRKYSFGEYRIHNPKLLCAILQAASYDTYGETFRVPLLRKMYGGSIRLRKEEMEQGFSASDVGIKQILFHKKGKIDLVFQDEKTCEDFSNRWFEKQTEK